MQFKTKNLKQIIMRIGVIGLGLIGGSIAKAIKEYTNHTVFGLDKDKNIIEKAIKNNVLDDKLTNDILRSLDVIYLCMYPDSNIRFIEKNLDNIDSNTIITDTSGVKSYVCNGIERIIKNKNIKFIGSHPMAGKEVNGFDNSDANLFKNASYIITPFDDTMLDEEAVLVKLAMNMGFTTVRRTDPKTHDIMIAYTSQIPHVLACAYVMCSECQTHDGFSAGSYRDVSRVAKINEDLWSELFLENREILTSQIDNLICNVVELKNLIDKNDRNGLRKALRKSRLIKENVDRYDEDDYS